MTDRQIFSGLPFVVLFLGQQAYCQLYTCRKTKWWHDGSDPASLFWGAFKFFLEDHKENGECLGHPHQKHVYLKQSRPKSPSQVVSEPSQRRLQLLVLLTPSPWPQVTSIYQCVCWFDIIHFVFCGAVLLLEYLSAWHKSISFNPHYKALAINVFFGKWGLERLKVIWTWYGGARGEIWTQIDWLTPDQTLYCSVRIVSVKDS